jgi:dCTP diphosphatase
LESTPNPNFDAPLPSETTFDTRSDGQNLEISPNPMIEPGGGPEVSDETCTVARLRDWMRSFTREREWEPFHTPKDLGVALAIEVGELLEHFRFLTDERIARKLADPAARREVAHELADVGYLVIRIADVLGIDLSAAMQEKIRLACLKYPADIVRGRSDKYTAYRSGEPREQHPVD